ncbi:MAG: DegT/DnrJ/EryC1/StrS family aminotransferase [Alphaproteobacteria bacterium]
MSAPIPFLDVGAAYTELKGPIDDAVAAAMASGWFILGEGLETFEREFAAWTGTGHCIGVGTGLDALTLTLRALDIGPGDEVLVPSQTFIATWLAVSQAGAVPVPVEVDLATSALDPAGIEARITSRTRAILPVHLYGCPVDLDPILTLAARHGLAVIEDAAQAHGARYRGRLLGGHGVAACWSFYPGKNLGAMGDGGAVTTNDPALAQRLRALRNYGSTVKYVHDEAGTNSRLDDLQARILSAKLPFLHAWNDRRRCIAALYTERLGGLADLRLLQVPEGAEPVWHLFPVFTPRRDDLKAHLERLGIQTQIHYPIPPHRQQAYAAMGLGPGSFPVAETLAATELSLPMGPHLSLEQAERVAEAVRDFLGTTTSPPPSEPVYLTVQEVIHRGLEHQRQGRRAEAWHHYTAILAALPDHPEALLLAGQVARDNGETERALGLLRRAFAVGSEHVPICNTLARLCQQVGAHQEAAVAFARAAELTPEDVQAWFIAGQAWRRAGDNARALEAFEHVTGLDNNHFMAWCERGLVHHLEGRQQQAVACFRNMAAIAPEIPETWTNLSAALVAAHQPTEAVITARRAARLRPDWVTAFRNLGAVLERNGLNQEAMEACRRVVELAPGDAGARSVLAGTLIRLGRHQEAIDTYRQALALEPANITVLNALGTHLPAAGGGAVALRRAVRVEPIFAEAWSNLAGIHRQLGQLDDAVACYRQALTIVPDHAAIYSNLLLTLCYHHGVSQDELFAEHRAWAAVHEAPHLPAIRSRVWRNDRNPDRRLRIGYVSGDFFDHAAVFFIQPLLAHHNHDRVHVTGYSQVSNPDNISRHLRSMADDWVDAVPLSDQDLFDRIQADGIDILVDCSGHTGHNRMPVLARKPAPIQAHWMGYAATTGLESMDYFISDPYAIPRYMERYFTERIWRLPAVYRTFKMIINPPEVAPLPLRQRGHPTFGSLNAFVKVTEETLVTWAELLRRVPEATLMFMGIASREQAEAAFARHGIGPERLEFVPRQGLAGFVDHVTRLVDVALDPFPHSGGTTTFHTLYVGVPIITLAGELPAGRGSLSILTNLGHPELIANTTAEYVDKAAELVRDPDRLEAVRMGLRGRMEASPYMDYSGFTRDLEDAYQAMWRQWLKETA